MLIGARQECVAGGQDIPEKMAILKHLGYDFLELSLSRDEIARLGPDSPREYLAAIERTGLPILSTSLGGFGNFAAASSEGQAAIAEGVRAMLRFTAAIGADAMLLATTEEGDNPAAYAEVYRRALRPLGDEAARLGITLAMEHVGWYKPAHLARLVRAIDHPAV